VAYFAPVITAQGISIPTYNDIRDQLLADARTIYGSDVYLGIDSPDYQMISIFSTMIYDAFLTAQAVYNSRGPATAVGSGLDVIVGLNGIKRKPAVYTTAIVTLTGTAGTMITNGVVEDANGYQWSLTSPAIIGTNGAVDVLATCQTEGPISAAPGEINKIVTPTLGWTSIINAAAATVGAYSESDAELRSRQASSTAQPSRTVLEGIKGGIFSISGVTRSEVYENDTKAVDSRGLPANSISAVVEGGTDADIANIIFSRKGPGCYTNGSITVPVTDQYGAVTPIRFSRPTYVDIDVVVNVKSFAGYTTETTSNIKSAVEDYCNSLSIGDSLLVSSLWGAALSANTIPNKPIFSVTSVTAAKHSQSQGTADIPIAYNQVTRGNVAYITVNVT